MNNNELEALHDKYLIDIINWDLAMTPLILTKTNI